MKNLTKKEKEKTEKIIDTYFDVHFMSNDEIDEVIRIAKKFELSKAFIAYLSELMNMKLPF